MNRNSRQRELANTPIKTVKKGGRIVMAMGMGMRMKMRMMRNVQAIL
jgi:hypothetical protein